MVSTQGHRNRVLTSAHDPKYSDQLVAVPPLISFGILGSPQIFATFIRTWYSHTALLKTLHTLTT